MLNMIFQWFRSFVKPKTMNEHIINFACALKFIRKINSIFPAYRQVQKAE